MLKTLQNKLIQGTIMLTIAGFITRLIGFAYRIFLADILGTKILGIYQLVFPVYGLCFTIYGAGIQTAISQLVASNIGTSLQKKKTDLSILRWGLFFSSILSCSLTAFLFFFADPVAEIFLLEPSCAPYLKILCFLFPFCGTSACINGYFYGMKEAKVPAVTQIIEQLVRVASVVSLSMFLSATGEMGCRIAVFGLVLGEAASCFYSCWKLFRAVCCDRREKRKMFLAEKQDVPTKNRIASSLLFLAFTLTTTKLVISVLHSVEAVFIPAALKQFGCSPQEALGIYGVLSGIALPFILFPSTITNSFAVMLLPAIAQAQAERSVRKIRAYVTLSGKYSLYIGYLFTGIFLLFGKEFGIGLFHSKNAGMYISVLSWLCPFLYLSTTLTSIINGLGKTQVTFFITAASLMVKIYFLVYQVPRYGMQAYLFGFLLSEIVATVLEAVYLREYLTFSAGKFFFIPGLCLVLTGYALKQLYVFLPVPQTGLLTVATLGIFSLALCTIYVIVLGCAGCISPKDLLGRIED